MNLDDLIAHLPIDLVRGPPGPGIDGVVDDARRAARGRLFVARRGSTADGASFIGDAIARGVTAVLTDRTTAVPDGPTHLVCDDPNALAGILAERRCGSPSRRLQLVGITGTNGKTTVAGLVQQLLAAAGSRCGVIGTVGVAYGDGTGEPAALTTPGPTDGSPLLARMVERGCAACAMEVSSHALDQGRVSGLHFGGAVFTNLSGDHLDYHGTMDAYAAAKARLFAAVDPAGFAIVNADDPAARRMVAACRARVLSVSLVDPGATCVAEVGALRVDATEVRLRGPWGVFDVQLPLVGRHNVHNALTAALVAWMLGADRPSLERGLAVAAAPPGRLEPVPSGPDDPAVFVDYAHTDDALDNVLRSVKPLVGDGRRLWVVFGCGGDRDRGKRPRMARVARHWGDEIVVTSDNPRTEDPERIIDDVMAGFDCAADGSGLRRNADRAGAIDEAIRAAAPGDVVVIAGKGHEDYQIIGTERRPFDDARVARAALARRAAPASASVPLRATTR